MRRGVSHYWRTICGTDKQIQLPGARKHAMGEIMKLLNRKKFLDPNQSLPASSASRGLGKALTDHPLWLQRMQASSNQTATSESGRPEISSARRAPPAPADTGSQGSLQPPACQVRGDEPHQADDACGGFPGRQSSLLRLSVKSLLIR